MNAFFFKEDRILKLRKQQQTMVELAVAKAAREVAVTKNAVEAIIDRIQQLDQLQGKDSTTLMHVSQVAIRMRSQLEASRMQLAEKKRALRATVENLQKATRAVESLTALETRQQKKHTRELQKQEQASIDAFSTRKWVEKGKSHV